MKDLNRPSNYYSEVRRSKILYIGKDHPYYETSNKGNISEPRLIMATHLGRNLVDTEIVYHRNEDYGDNSVGNLIILSRAELDRIVTWKRLNEQKLRIISKMSVIERELTEVDIDPSTLSRSNEEDRYREVDRDRVRYENSRRGKGEDEETED